MSDDKINSDNVNATMITPAQDIGATRISPSEELNANEDVGATVFIAPEIDDLDATQVFAPVDLGENQDAPVADGATNVMSAVKAGKTGEMDAVPSSQASSFDILLGRSGVVEGRQFELKKNKLTIGRSPFNDIIIKSDSVSASHAELKRGKGRWILRDIGSVNGISVNGEYGGQGDEFDLAVSDQILIGDAILQLCSPHTIDEMLALPLMLKSARSYNKLYIIVGGLIATTIVVAFLLI